MAGIKGQPTPTPANLKSPVPTAINLTPEEQAEFEAARSKMKPTTTDIQLTPDEQAEFNAALGAQSTQPSAMTRALETTAEYLPPALGLAGGIVGTALGPAGSVAGAALGGAAGQGYKEFINTQLLKKAPAQNPLKEAAMAGIEEGASQVVGGAIGKAAGAAASAAGKFAKVPMEFMSGAIEAAKDGIVGPVRKLFMDKGTQLTSEASGDAVKSLLRENIMRRYGPFIQAYGDLDTVAKSLPLGDESRRSFTMKLREWGASDLGGDNYRMLKKFVNDLDAADSGKRFDDVIRSIADARGRAFESGASNQANFLKELQGRAEEFMERQTSGLAAKIAGGKATPQELNFLTQMAQAKGLLPPTDPAKYAKELAQNYLKEKESVKGAYAGFRSFLEDVAEQTRTKAKKRGPMQFVNDLDEIPSEKLVERMFDPKNAAALRAMQKETPEVFEQVAKARVQNMVDKASVTGTLDLNKLRKEMNALPAATRSILFKSDEVAQVNKLLDDPKLAKLEGLAKVMENFVIKWADNVEQAATVAAPKVPLRPRAAVRQVVGKAAVTSGKSLYDAYKQPEPE